MNRITGWVGGIVLFSLAASPAFGVNLFWQGSGFVGDFRGNNWSNTTGGINLPPGTADVMHIGGNGNATYSEPGPVTYSKLRVGHNQTPAGAPAGSNGIGTARITNGAQMLLNGGTGGDSAGAALWVGNARNGTLTIDGPGTTVTSNSYVTIGHANNVNNLGTLNVENGAELIVTTGSIEMGNGTGTGLPTDTPPAGPNGTSGKLTLSGEGSKITVVQNNQNLVVGKHAAKGEYIQSNGTLDVENHIYVGRDRANSSSFKVSGGIVNAGAMSVGADGAETTWELYPDNCVAEFSGTAKVTIDTNNLNIGLGDSANASLTIADQAEVVLTPTAVNGTNGNVFLGRFSSTGARFNMTGGTLTTGRHFLMGTSGGTDIVGTQSAGTITTTENFVLADTGGESTYNLSGLGQVIANGSVIVGRQSAAAGPHVTGTMNQTGGSVSAALGLLIGNRVIAGSHATGIYNVSDGTIAANHPTGTGLSIGELGIGTLKVIGGDAEIKVGTDVASANMVVGSSTEIGAQGTLAYQLEAGELLSTITVSGSATFNAGSVLSLDITNEPTPAASYDVLTAASIDTIGLTFSGPEGWDFDVVDGGQGKMLRFVQDADPGLPGDHNGDNVVDILDYVVWGADPDNNGGDPEGFEDWAENYGNPPGSGSGQGQTSAVPEPATGSMILAIGLIGSLSRALRRR